MFKQKSQLSWSIILAIVIVSAIYMLAALIILESHNENISFTKKEIEGLHDYKRVAHLYFELNSTKQPKVAVTKLLQLPASPHTKSWQRAKAALALTHTHTFADTSTVFRHLIRDIADESNLILDPEIGSYYSMDIMVNHVPLLVEHILIYSNNEAASLRDSPYHMENLYHSIQVLNQENCSECKDLIRLTKRINSELSTRSGIGISVQKTIDLLHDVEQIAQISSHILESLLHERLQQQTSKLYVTLAIVIGLYAFLIALIVISLRNYVSKSEVNLAKERQEHITQLAQKNNELEKFAYAAAHDLKEPVRTMRCFADLLKSESLDDLKENTAEYVRVIGNAAHRAEQMINDLLGYTKVSEQALAVELCDCNSQIAAVLQDIKPAIDAVKPTIKIAPLPSIQTVPSMFRRVILNLIDNAIKYRKRNVPLIIHIDAQKQNESWLFLVQDNGMGLPSEHTETVFEPFRRLEPGMHKEGSGIGLTSCRKIIERLGGKIWINSDQEQGTSVYFTLPAR